MVILNKKRFLTLMVVFVLIAIIDVFIITTRSSRAGGGNSGGSYVSGGNNGCSGEVNTCQGASWQYYSHDFSSEPTMPIASYNNSFAPGATIAGCDDADGYYLYAWAKYGNTSNQVGTAAVGSGGDYEETVFASIFFEYPMRIPNWGSYGDYCYALDYCNGPNNLYIGYDGNAMWYRGGMNYAQGWDHWKNVYDKFVEVSSTNNFKGNVRTWNRDSSLSWFCYWEDKKVTLSGVAVDMDGIKLGNNPDSATVKAGDKASITAKSISGYEFKGWRSSQTSGMPSGSSTYSTTLNADTTVYAVYDATYYEGYSKINTTVKVGDNNYTVNNSTGWTSSDKSIISYLPCGSFCDLEFTHGVRKKSGGLDSSNYAISDNKGKTIVSGSKITAVTPNENTNTSKMEKGLAVGDTYCQTLKFPKQSNKTDMVETEACVSAPYNFNIKTDVDDSDSVVYAGETVIKKDAYIEVEKRKNETIGGVEYATEVPNAKYRFIAYYGKDAREKEGTNNYASNNTCSYFESAASCNIVSEHEGETLKIGKTTKQQEFQIPDVEAGTRFCVAVAVYPATSGIDLKMNSNWSETPESNKWAISRSKCYPVAKKPLFQVWGGSVYSADDIKAYTTNKIFDGQSHFYGSWAELSLVAGSKNDKLASGASLSNALGGASNNFGLYSPLTISNDESSGSGVKKPDNKRLGLVEKFRNETNSYGGNREYSASPELAGTTLIALTDGQNAFDMTISGNLENRDKEISSLDDIPVLILYAKNINIDCSVKRIDAILIAEDTIDTCYNPDNSDSDPEKNDKGKEKNAKNRSNQLIINGTVIADYLKLGRTYGAGTGTNSGVPAEIINASTGIYLWGIADENIDNSNKAFTSYMRELSPRY